MSEGENGELNIFDLTGRKIIGWQMIGGQSIYTFDASILPSGTYIYQVRTAERVLTTDRLIMIRE